MVSPLQRFINNQVTASVFLLIAVIAALVCANTPALTAIYFKVKNLNIGLYFGQNLYCKPLIFWINDVLLTSFFFMVGLEIKREFLVGEFSELKKSMMIIFAAVGGMVVPALLFAVVNYNAGHLSAWPIPTSTDTAFTLGLLICFKKHLPTTIFTFLIGVAIIDDIIAIVLIAVLYTQSVNVGMLFITLCLFLLLGLANFLGFKQKLIYIFLGSCMWCFMEKAGVHGTLCGILVAFMIPATPKQGQRQFSERIRKLLQLFDARKQNNEQVLEDKKQHNILENVQRIAKQTSTPLQSWESQLETPITLVVLPLFAFFNAGIQFNSKIIYNIFVTPLSIGIIVGLVIGKPLGVSLFAWLSNKLNLSHLPKGTRLKDIFSVSCLMGIGFTISIMIANLSLDNAILPLAKASILLASLLSAIVGTFCLVFLCRVRARLS
jgi:NhaA family Na+:H+ antiporter